MSLKEDIDFFIEEKVKKFLDDLLQRMLKHTLPSEEREMLKLVENFVQKVQKTDLSERTLPPDLQMIAQWKKEFTKKILLPRYLTEETLPSIAEVPVLMKASILAKAREQKVQFYIQMCKQRLMRQLKPIAEASRLLKAKQIVASSAEDFQKSDQDFQKIPFFEAFQTGDIKKILNKVPLKGGLTQEEEKELKKARDSFQKILLQKLQSQENLTAKLHVIHSFVLHPNKNQPPFIQKGIEELLLQTKAELLLHACRKELEEAKKKFPFEAFPKQREAILKKYQTHYLNDRTLRDKRVKERFNALFAEEESKARLESYHKEILTKTPIQKPKKSKGWKV